MSRYLLLLLINLPFALISILSAFTQYKLNKITRNRMIVTIAFWVIVITGIAMAEPIYIWLYSHSLTETEPLSLFDVIQLTAIVIALYVISRHNTRIATLEKRLTSLHQELSITLSKKQ